jgi:hypothetical protein
MKLKKGGKHVKNRQEVVGERGTVGGTALFFAGGMCRRSSAYTNDTNDTNNTNNTATNRSV